MQRQKKARPDEYQSSGRAVEAMQSEQNNPPSYCNTDNPKQQTPSVQKNIVYESLPSGAENAIPGRVLAASLGYSSIRQLQKEIRRERDSGVVICSGASRPGYFRPRTKAEVEMFIRRNNSTAINIFKAIQSAKKLLSTLGE